MEMATDHTEPGQDSEDAERLPPFDPAIQAQLDRDTARIAQGLDPEGRGVTYEELLRLAKPAN